MEATVARRLLEAERDRLVSVRRALEHELPHEDDGDRPGDRTPLDRHEADLAGDLFEREKDLSLLGRVDDELGEVDEALRRLGEGTYGWCQACAEPIPDERLDAVPATRFCTVHEGSWEGGGGSVGGDAPAASALAEREALEHLDLVLADDDADDLRLGPEELALHSVRPSEEPSVRLTPEEVERMELQAAEGREPPP